MIRMSINDIGIGSRVILVLTDCDVVFKCEDGECIKINVDGLTGIVIRKLQGIFLEYLIKMDDLSSLPNKIRLNLKEWKVNEAIVELY